MSVVTPAPLRRSRRRRILFGVLTALFVLAIAEGAARVTMWLVTAGDWTGSQTSLAEFGMDLHDLGSVLHPYIGTAYDPNVHPGHPLDDLLVPVNRLGFPDADDPVQKRDPGKLIVGVLGGSVAWQMSQLGEQRLKETLRADPRFRDREIVVVSLAFSTGKQPQQVMAVNFVQALGGEFDVLVNLDGFNEIALARENIWTGSHYSYPRMWTYRIGRRPDGRILAEFYRSEEIRAERQQLARNISRSWLRGLALRQVLWKVQDIQLEREAVALMQAMVSVNSLDANTFERNGPGEPPSPIPEQMAKCVDLWERSSLQLQAIADFHGITYVHALQPNQYVAGSKPMTDEEAGKAIDRLCMYCESVENGYALLQQRGAALRARGVNFVDLTDIFKEIETPLYIDTCCHVNRLGNELMAERVAQEILRALNRKRGS